MIFRKPCKFLVLPLTKPINDARDDPRLVKAKPVYVDNTMPMRDWSEYDAPAKLRMKKRKPTQKREMPIFLRAIAS